MKPSTHATAVAPDPASRSWDAGRWGLLLVLAGNMLIDSLEVSTAMVALPSIGRDLDLPLTVLQGVVTGFALGFGALLLFGARVVERLGRRRVYLSALLGFAAASVAGGLAGGPVLLIACRVVKGFCAALTAPTGLTIVTTAFPEGRARSRAVSVYASVGACGFTGGLVLSGLLTGSDWRWTFLFPAPVVLVLFVFGLRLIPAGEPGAAARPCDLAGAAALTGCLAALVTGVVQVPGHGWGSPLAVGAFAAAAALLGVFLLVERTAADPLFRPGLLARPDLARAVLGAVALNGSYLGLLLVATFHLQVTEGWSPARTAFALLPASLPLAVTAPLSGRLIERFGTRRLIALGAPAPVLGHLLYLRALTPHPAYATDVLPTMLLIGAGFALGFTALNVQAASAVPAADRAAATGHYQTAVQTAAVLAPALVAALLAAHGAPDAPAAGYRPAVWLVVALGALGPVAALARPVRRSAAGRAAEPGPTARP
ncbi:MFS transporter [Streptomyces echinoruber]|uniref:MFS transporter n=1 Tax=Streptomyces echinoruber TaxID=68898 RepID=A0A918S278_9ACTN|nr:MFS transporter [Streptomyces echinoruber]GHA18328.1 MFS transporter [Streptomyces echinoruber]